LNHPSEKKRLKIKDLEHVLIGKVDQLFRNMLWIAAIPTLPNAGKLQSDIDQLTSGKSAGSDPKS
jgi:hypothetical protein